MRVWVGVVLVLVLGAHAQLDGIDLGSPKVGRCPLTVMDSSLCNAQTDQCNDDIECSGDFKCCSTGCSKVCVKPLFTACQQQRVGAERRSRAIGESVWAPECTEQGDFKEIQCQDDTCWCVNTGGFEKPGTRARSIQNVNCSNPRPCAGYLCRMLCPYGFDLDEEGCPLCQCRDPCRGVKCPNSLSCELQDVPCIKEPCPPLPTCKQPRSLSSLCPIGEPLTITGGKRPFLCGNDPGKPPCPPMYQCIVQPGHEYGVCCNHKDRISKPGSCPRAPFHQLQPCGERCQNDLHCTANKKCCDSELCGRSCMQPHKMTACMWQRQLAEVMSVSEKEGKGYIPQCDGSGDFEPRQCSRNGLVCWCVDSKGNKLSRSIGSADDVQCTDKPETRTSCGSTDRCAQICEYGYVVDNNGCSTCECARPCDGYQCPQGTRCVVVRDKHCSDSTLCASYPECQIEPLPKNPCAEGEPLRDIETSEILTCYPGVAECPGSAECVIDYQTRNAYCCPTSSPEPIIKPGFCPSINYTDEIEECSQDADCRGEKKCCKYQCVQPLQNFAETLPTMCEFVREHGRNVDNGFSLGIHLPECDDSGSYVPKQCTEDRCWCVDEFGTTLPNTTRDRNEDLDCDAIIDSLDCLGLVCRLGCDYGFVLDDHSSCHLCECRDPCKDSVCTDGYMCVMQETSCNGAYCPSIPKCVPVKTLKEECIFGKALLSLDGTPVTCDEWGDACPIGYECSASHHGGAICCPRDPLAAKEGVCPAGLDSDLCIEQCKVDKDCPGPQKCCLNGCGAQVCRDPYGDLGKAGQCPYLVPFGVGNCDYKCRSDYDCFGDKKCCSNGCGTACMDSLLFTSCQHAKALIEYQARESGLLPGRVYIPQCRNTDGRYQIRQCHPGTGECWCVDEDDGKEIHGTRSTNKTESCNVIEDRSDDGPPCPLIECNLSCPHGYDLNDKGCPRCSCLDPCANISCRGPHKQCRLVQLRCSGDEACPPLPMCLPPLHNPCSEGLPLPKPCGPHGTSCPSSHLCHLSPLHEYATCCPKPKDVCQISKEEGSCNSTVQRWYFNAEEQQCQSFNYNGCGGNANNFQNIHDCRTVCPVLTMCERIREKNSKMALKFKLSTFIPECDIITGAWKPTQCLPQLGVCWCVDKDGSHVSGTLIRGKPKCSRRNARVLNHDQPICDNNTLIHVCDPSLCDGLVCLGDPQAVCRVNPCGGCSVEFYNDVGRVNCTQDLTSCMKRHQQVLNSYQWRTISQESNGARRSDSGRSREVKGPLSAIINLIFGRSKREANWPNPDVEVFDWDSIRRLPQNMPKLLRDPPTTLNDLFSRFIQPASSTTANPPTLLPVVKNGQCPLLALGDILSLLHPQCTDSCADDSHCPGLTKCCPGICGMQCMQPTNLLHDQETKLEVGMPVSLPACLEDNRWSPVQWTGDLAWCVDEEGTPQHHTLTRGTLHCANGGKMVERITDGHICPQGVQPKVCIDQCDSARCFAHPNAQCRANPCKNCQVSFYVDDRKVSCEPVCQQPKAKGSCSEKHFRFWYNSTSNKCESFEYTGCGGNDNAFFSLESCQSQCLQKGKEGICDLHKDIGSCNSSLPRWWYNSFTHHCELFHYGGCGGNHNNFVSKNHCEAACPRVVACGTLPDDPQLGIVTCNRQQLCDSMFCSEHPLAMCIVDPCTCTAQLKDPDGQLLQCNTTNTQLHTENVESKCVMEQKERPSSQNIPQCDKNGKFMPTQCNTEQKLCWCVDEAGRRIKQSKEFRKGEKECEWVGVEMVAVTLGFDTDSPVTEEELRRGVAAMLKSLGADLGSTGLSVYFIPEAKQVKFTLLGNKKVDLAHYLQKKVTTGSLKVETNKASLLVNNKSSWIHHELEPESRSESYAREIVEHAAASFNAPYLAVIIIFSVLSLIIVCAMVVAVVMYRRKTTGSYPKESMENMAFSSTVYDIKSSLGRSPVDLYTHTTEHYYETMRQNAINELAKVHQ